MPKALSDFGSFAMLPINSIGEAFGFVAMERNKKRIRNFVLLGTAAQGANAPPESIRRHREAWRSA